VSIQGYKGKFHGTKKSKSEERLNMVVSRKWKSILRCAHSLPQEEAEKGSPFRSLKAIPKASLYLNPALDTWTEIV
jgi:hypothetical protein